MRSVNYALLAGLLISVLSGCAIETEPAGVFYGSGATYEDPFYYIYPPYAYHDRTRVIHERENFSRRIERDEHHGMSFSRHVGGGREGAHGHFSAGRHR